MTEVYDGRSVPSARRSPLWNPESAVSSMNGMKKSAFNELSHSAERTSWAYTAAWCASVATGTFSVPV